MRVFRIALTGDFLNESGEPAYGDCGLPLLDRSPAIRYHFLHDQAPRAGDAEYWTNLYSMKVRAEHLTGVNGLIVLRPYVTRETFAHGADELVVIGRSGAGYDKIDLAACTEHDVLVFNAPVGLHHATASSALLFMLALAKRLPEHERVARSGDWRVQPDILGGELQGRTLGIVGLGNSGRELVRLVAPFAMRVLAHSSHVDQAEAAALGVELVSLEQLFREADFVSLHARLTDENRRMIGAGQLALMKPTAYFINVARGELVDEGALVDALAERRIAGAALDVFETEPLPPQHPLWKMENVIITPHIAAASPRIAERHLEMLLDNLRRFVAGQPLRNVVNKSRWC